MLFYKLIAFRPLQIVRAAAYGSKSLTDQSPAELNQNQRKRSNKTDVVNKKS